MSLLTVEGLTKRFPLGATGLFSRKKESVRAVTEVSFSIEKGETLGLVGESGCGKSTLGRCLIRLIEPSVGKVVYGGKNLLELSGPEMRRMRRKVQIIFQDPYAS
ncbi:MAG: ATP-binding cassette domain-containing protein, partial [Bdellovibrionota bacterium]